MNKIKKYRNQIRVTQKEVAELVGVNQSSINRYETTNRKITIDMAWLIVRALNQLGAKCGFCDVFPNPTELNDTKVSH